MIVFRQFTDSVDCLFYCYYISRRDVAMKLTKREENSILKDFNGYGIILSVKMIAKFNEILAEREELYESNANESVCHESLC